MNKRSHLVVLAVGATLALASTAQGSSSMSYDYTSHYLTAKAQKTAHLKAQRQAKLRAFWRAHGPGGVAPGGVSAEPATAATAIPSDMRATGNTGTPCGYGDWCE